MKHLFVVGEMNTKQAIEQYESNVRKYVARLIRLAKNSDEIVVLKKILDVLNVKVV